MGNYNNDYEGGGNRQRDFVLNMNEFAHILSKTDGSIKCAVGPFQTSLSQQEMPVIFNTQNKRFEECSDYDRAKQLFVSAPEGWYIVLKNPTADGRHPESGRASQAPTNIEIGKKINISGPTSFALYPGQMAKTICGHRLKTNQYLVARVYDADAANGSDGYVVNNSENAETEKTEVPATPAYYQGQQIVIKGTDVAFYIPPTGIEVVPTSDGDYVRDAVTLERLEYCILKSENGEKRYCHGPAVVFPEPTESFIKTTSGSYCFRAIELSKISGIYVKVVAAYKDEQGKNHPIGEELFITGNEQMIYYPRPEHAIITYDNKMVHHAIAIPKGEGRYVMNRETGEITTKLGPCMFLPDPRTQVIVKRKLTAKQCALWYPNNTEVMAYNQELTEKTVEKSLHKAATARDMVTLNNLCCSSVDTAAMDLLEANAGISRGTSYTKPRTITIDNKYDGVVAIDVWTGYAINVVSKSGKREVVVGPKTRLLDYDETLEYMELSTGKPKTTDNLLSTVYLRVENNKISDIINASTKDFVEMNIKVSYCVDFLEDYKDKWFSVENYVKYLCDQIRSILKAEVKQYTIEEFYSRGTEIIQEALLADGDMVFEENGMSLKNVEVLSVCVDAEVADMIKSHQHEIVKKNLELSNAKKKFDIDKQLIDFDMQEAKLQHEATIQKLQRENAIREEKVIKDTAYEAKMQAKQKAAKQAEADLQPILDAIHNAELKREDQSNESTLEYLRESQGIEEEKQKAYAATVQQIMDAISPDLIASMTSRANAELVETLAENMSPLAIANGESVADTTRKLLSGTSVEDFLKNMMQTKLQTK